MNSHSPLSNLRAVTPTLLVMFAAFGCGAADAGDDEAPVVISAPTESEGTAGQNSRANDDAEAEATPVATDDDRRDDGDIEVDTGPDESRRCTPAEPQSVASYSAGPATRLTTLVFDSGSFTRNTEGWGLDLNSTLASELDGGCVNVVFEYDGLQQLADPFGVNVWLAQMSSEDTVSIDPTSMDDQSARHGFDNATIRDGQLTATAGTMEIPVDFGGARINLPLIHVTLEADVESSGAGLTLTNGKLDAVIETRELFTRINDAAADCACLGLTGELLTEYGVCTDADTRACEDAGEFRCAQIANECNLWSALDLFSDVDLDDDGLDDAVTVGASFGGAPVSIAGVSVF